MSKFLKACRRGSAEDVLKEIGKVGKPDESRSKADETGLHICVGYNKTPAIIAEILLTHGHDANIRGYGSENKTALHVACRRGDVGSVAVLLNHGARVNAVKAGDWTPLMVACANGHADVVDALLSHGADVTSTNHLGESCVHLSARSDVGCLRRVITAGGSIAQRTRNGKTGLQYAARAGNVEALKLLLRGGCDVRGDCGGATLAHEACVGGHVAVLEVVKEFDRALLVGSDDSGLSCLHYAAIHGHLRVVEFLLECGDVVDGVEDQDRRGFTPLRLALWNGHDQIVKLLLSVGARLEESWIAERRRLDTMKHGSNVRKET